MTDDEQLQAWLSAGNPVDRELVASRLPPGVGDAMVREIVSTRHPSRWRQLVDAIGPVAVPAWGRVGFVGVLALIAGATIVLRPGTMGGGPADDVAVPAGVVEVEVPDDATPQPSTDADTATSVDPSAPVDGEPEGEGTAAQPGDTAATDTSGADALQADDQGSGPGSVQPDAEAPPLVGRTVDGGDCVLIEAEQLELTGAWSPQGDSAASGGSFIVWKGLAFERSNDAPADVIRGSIEITQPGSYRFLWAMRQPPEVADDRADSTWVDFPDAARFGPVGGGSYGGFVAVHGAARDQFAWSATAVQEGVASEIAVEFARAGTYTLELAGRSHGHQIDRLALYRDPVDAPDQAGGCTA